MSIREIFANYALIQSVIVVIITYYFISYRKWKCKIFLAWYDLWIGGFWNINKRVFYYNPFPCLVISFSDPRNVWIDGKWEIKK